MRRQHPREGANAIPHAPRNAETPFASYFDFGRPRILMFCLTAVSFQPKVLKQVAGRRRKGRNIVIRCVAPRKGANKVLRDPTSAETPFEEVSVRTFAGVKLRAGVPGTISPTISPSPVYYLTISPSILLLQIYIHSEAFAMGGPIFCAGKHPSVGGGPCTLASGGNRICSRINIWNKWHATYSIE